MIRCIAIDDEPLALKQIAGYIAKTPFLELAGTCESALQALELLENTAVDLMFVDINMPDLSGMDFV
ncbi:MAG: response regulator, partial [Bacteroidota bacterium]